MQRFELSTKIRGIEVREACYSWVHCVPKSLCLLGALCTLDGWCAAKPLSCEASARFGSYRGVVLVLVVLVMTRPRSPKTVFICVFYCVFGIGDFAVRKVYLFQLFEKSPLLVFKHFHVLHLSSSFQQNWFHVIRTSFAKVIEFPVCEKEFLTFPIYLDRKSVV